MPKSEFTPSGKRLPKRFHNGRHRKVAQRLESAMARKAPIAEKKRRRRMALKPVMAMVQEALEAWFDVPSVLNPEELSEAWTDFYASDKGKYFWELDSARRALEEVPEGFSVVDEPTRGEVSEHEIEEAIGLLEEVLA